MDLSKFYSLNDFDLGTNEIGFSKNGEQLNQVLKKILDLEEEILDFSDIPIIIKKFSELHESSYKSPIYFTLGYLATLRDWDTIWKLEAKLSKWLGVPLMSFHSIRYYRLLTRSK